MLISIWPRPAEWTGFRAGDNPRLSQAVFDGNGHAISHLTISGGGNLGLFGGLYGEVKNLGVAGCQRNRFGLLSRWAGGGEQGYSDPVLTAPVRSVALLGSAGWWGTGTTVVL